MPTERQVLDYLLMGLTWRTEERGDLQPYRASIVLRAFCQAGLLTEAERRRTSTNQPLIDLTTRYTELLKYDNHRPPKKPIAQLASSINKHLIVLVKPSDKVEVRRFFGADGYFMLVTVAGQNYARRVMSAYSGSINARAFREAWEAEFLPASRQTGDAKRPQEGPTAATPDETSRGQLRDPDEWRW